MQVSLRGFFGHVLTVSEPYVTYAEAGRLLGERSVHFVQSLVHRGRIERRPDHRSGNRPSLVRASVLRVRDELVEEQAEAARRQVERERLRRLRSRYVGEPPSLDTEWWSAVQVAKALGLTRTGVAKRQARGKLPFERHQGRVWFRADLVRLIANAERVRREGEAGLASTLDP